MFIVVENVKFVELNICDTCYFKLSLTRYKKRLHKYLKKNQKSGFEHFPQSKDKVPRRIQIWFHNFFCQSFGTSICGTCNLCVLQANTPCSRSSDRINCSVCVDLHLKWWWAVWNESKFASCLILSTYLHIECMLLDGLVFIMSMIRGSCKHSWAKSTF